MCRISPCRPIPTTMKLILLDTLLVMTIIDVADAHDLRTLPRLAADAHDLRPPGVAAAAPATDGKVNAIGTVELGEFAIQYVVPLSDLDPAIA
jgi:hypothetical protein